MIVNLQIRLKSRIVADKRVPEGTPDNQKWVRRFSTTPEEEHPLNLIEWQRVIRNAVSDLNLDEVDPEQVIFPTTIRKPRYVRFSRSFTTPGNRQDEKKEEFECVDIGNILTIPVFIFNEAAHSFSSQRPPTLEEFRKIMEFVGAHIGISPFGNQFGYGRFTIHKIETANDATATDNTPDPIRQPPADNPNTPAVGTTPVV